MYNGRETCSRSCSEATFPGPDALLLPDFGKIKFKLWYYPEQLNLISIVHSYVKKLMNCSFLFQDRLYFVMEFVNGKFHKT